MNVIASIVAQILRDITNVKNDVTTIKANTTRATTTSGSFTFGDLTVREGESLIKGVVQATERAIQNTIAQNRQIIISNLTRSIINTEQSIRRDINAQTGILNNIIRASIEPLRSDIRFVNSGVLSSINELKNEIRKNFTASRNLMQNNTSIVIRTINQEIEGVKGQILRSSATQSTAINTASQNIGRMINTLNTVLPDNLTTDFWEKKPQDYTQEEINSINQILRIFSDSLGNEIRDVLLSGEFRNQLHNTQDEAFNLFTLFLDAISTVSDIVGVVIQGLEVGGSVIAEALDLATPDQLIADTARAGYDPFIRHIYNQASFEARSDLLSIDYVLAMVSRFPDREQWGKGVLQYHGITDEDIEKLMSMTKSLMSEPEIRLLFIRDDLNLADAVNAMVRLGFRQHEIEMKMRLWKLQPTVQDLVRFAVRDVFDPDVRIQAGLDEELPQALRARAREIGMSDQLIEEYWAAHFLLPSLNQGFEMLQRRVIDEDKLHSLFKAADVAPNWREDLLKISYKPITRVDVRRMHAMGVFETREELVNRYKDVGYDDANANLMADWTELYNARTGGNIDSVKTLSLSLITKAYTRGVLDEIEAIKEMNSLGWSTEDARRYLEINLQLRNIGSVPDKLTDNYKRVERFVSKAYLRGTLDETETNEQLIAIGYTEQEAKAEIGMLDWERELQLLDMIGNLIKDRFVSFQITTQETKVLLIQAGFTSLEADNSIREWEFLRANRSRLPTKSEVEKMVTKQIIAVPEAVNMLKGMGYSDKIIGYYLIEWDIVPARA